MTVSPKGNVTPEASIHDLSESALDLFRARPLVVLSPHFDDACFSLGAFLFDVGHGELINVFTQGDYLAAFKQPQSHAFALRDREDANFATRCGLNRHDMGCEEPARRGRRPSDLSRLEEDIAQVARPTLAKLMMLSDGFGSARGVLFAPLGVGRHVNHRAVCQFVLANLDTLGTRFDIYLYEDLPYARNPLQRLSALWRARKVARLGARHVFRPFWPNKKSLLEHYPSQLRHTPSPARFRPRALVPRALHEAFWPVTPKFSQKANSC